MQKALTNKTLEALKPQAKRYEVHDLYCPRNERPCVSDRQHHI